MGIYLSLICCKQNRSGYYTPNPWPGGFAFCKLLWLWESRWAVRGRIGDEWLFFFMPQPAKPAAGIQAKVPPRLRTSSILQVPRAHLRFSSTTWACNARLALLLARILLLHLTPCALFESLFRLLKCPWLLAASGFEPPRTVYSCSVC